MTTIGTPLTPKALKVMMLGAGELGKEVVIELQRLGVEVIAVDRYENAPAQQVAHRAYTISMLDGAALRAVVEKERPDFIVPEVEAIATDTLLVLLRPWTKRHSYPRSNPIRMGLRPRRRTCRCRTRHCGRVH